MTSKASTRPAKPSTSPPRCADLLQGTFITDHFTELEQVKTRVFGDTGIVISRFKARDSPARGLVTHVYILRRGRWECVASHASWATGGVCPAIGPIAEARNLVRPSATAAQNCMVCHVSTPKQKFPPAPLSAQPPAAAKEQPGQTVRVEIDADGHITMEGSRVLSTRTTVAAEKKALEDRFKAGKEKLGWDSVVVAAAAERAVLGRRHGPGRGTVRRLTSAPFRAARRAIAIANNRRADLAGWPAGEPGRSSHVGPPALRLPGREDPCRGRGGGQEGRPADRAVQHRPGRGQERARDGRAASGVATRRSTTTRSPWPNPKTIPTKEY